MMARLKSIAGGNRNSHVITVPGVQGDTIADLDVPDDSNIFAFTTAEEGITITRLAATQGTRNRKVVFYMKPVVDTSGFITLTNNDTPTLPGEMDLGGSDITLDPTDVLVMLLRTDGTWVRLRHTDN